MHDPSSTGYYQAIIMKQPEFPEQEQQLKCPRCDSTNTKFCYYNNYNLSQPRHFCKSCRRYWTKGGALRNIPVGGGSRKNTKRSGSGSSSSSGNPKKTHFVRNPDPGRNSGTHDPSPPPSSSESLRLGSNPMARIAGFLGNPGQDPTRLYGLPIVGDQGLDIGGSFSSLLASNMQLGGILDGLNGNGSGLHPGMGIGGMDGSNGSDGWTDLSMNTGGSSFQ